MPKVKSKLKSSLLRLQQEKQLRDKHAATIANAEAKLKSVNKPKVKRIKNVEERQKQFPPVPYEQGERILLVGEGNFSFARSLCEHMFKECSHTITATTNDTEAVAYEKYTDARAHVSVIREYGGVVIFEVDATQLDKCKPLKKRTFDKIVFNFPHVGLGIKHQSRNILANQTLIQQFLQSSLAFLSSSSSEIHITLKTGVPYDDWQVKRIAKALGYVTKETIRFYPEMYPSYEHRRTIGFKDNVSVGGNKELEDKRCNTIMFWREKEGHIRNEGDHKNNNSDSE